MQTILMVLAVINAAVFALYGYDKHRAVRRKWRVPERTLLLAAALFGAAGALMGMFVFRHKIRKPKFYITVPLFLVLQAALAVSILIKTV